MKTCKKCNTVKPLSQFSLAPANRDGHNTKCKPCIVQRNKEYWRTPVGRISYIFNNQKRSSIDRGHSPPSYTQKELTDWAMARGLEALVQTWKTHNYPKGLAPSVDRLDDSLGYTLENIQLVTWDTNNEKMYTDRKSCKRVTAQNRRVMQISLTGSVISTFESISMAARSTGITRININDVCRQKKHCLTAGGYYWQYA